MKKIIIIIFLLIFSNYSFADQKFEKDLKKVSKNSSFIDGNRKAYSEDQITDKKNTILIIYTHGASGDQDFDNCTKPWNKVPPVILNLHGKKIGNLNINIYRLCSGVRGWSGKEQTQMWKAHKKLGKLDLELADKEGIPLIKKQKQNQKLKVIKRKVDKFVEQGFENIVLAGHSSGGWQSVKIKAKFPELVKGVIGLHAGAGGHIKNRKDWPWWEDVRYYGFVKDLSQLNAIFINHDKDHYNAPKDYALFSNLSLVTFVNLTESGCKKKKTFNDYHGIALTKCYADYEDENKDIIKYLENLF